MLPVRRVLVKVQAVFTLVVRAESDLGQARLDTCVRSYLRLSAPLRPVRL